MSLVLPEKSVAVVLGTRPEVVKLAGVIRLLGPMARVIHSGQHFDTRLSKVFFDAFGLGDPDMSFEVGGMGRGVQIGEATLQLSQAFESDPPAAVIVQGDTNTTLAGALAANGTGSPLMHVEAGLRSFDRRMPEEHNRVLTDHLADICCAPTAINVSNLANEGIGADRTSLTGNTVVEALQELLPAAAVRAALCARYDVEPGSFVLATFHRPENVDDPDRLASILGQLSALPMPVVFPVHPRTARNVADFGLEDGLSNLTTAEPLGYREFLGLAAEAALLVSDSGGIQEEASVLKRPVVVVRRSTERPEVLGTFAQLVEPGPGIAQAASCWLDDLPAVLERLAALDSPYGDGTASANCVDALAAELG